MNSKKRKLKRCNPVFAGSSTVTLLALLALLTTTAGCAAFKRPLLHPLVDDFELLNQGETLIAPKQGAFVSNYYLCKVMAVDVEGLPCKDVH